MVPPVSMTRSFINPKDRMAEVARRRQEAEKELRRRREDRLRQLEERSENALKRKQMGLQEKLSKNKTEAEHLREVNKRRLEKENQEKERIQKLLEKKSSPPRTTQSTTKPKSTVAFGSGVPRRIEIAKGASNRSASSSSMNATLNTTTNSLMTRSLHPAFNSAKERPTLRANAKPPTRQPMANKPPVKPVNNRPAPRPTASPRKSTENRMTRSVHPELCPTPNKRTFEMSQNSKPVVSKRTVQQASAKPPTKAEPKLKKKEDEVVPNIVIANESTVSKSTDSGINEPMEVHKIESVDLVKPVVEKNEEPQNLNNEKVEEPQILDNEKVEEPKMEVQNIEEPKVLINGKVEEPKVEVQNIESTENIVSSEPIINLDEPIVEVQKKDELMNVPNEEIVDLQVEEPNAQTQKVEEALNDSMIDLSESTVEPLQVEEAPIFDLAEEEIVESKVEEPISNEEPTNIEPISTNQSDSVQPVSTEFGQIFDMGTSEEIPEPVPQSEYIHNRSSSDDRDSTRTRTLTPQPVFSDDEHDSGVVPETPSPPMTEQESLIANESKTNHLFLLNTNNGLNGTPHTLDTVLSAQSSNQVPIDPEQTQKEHVGNNQPPTLTNVGNGVVIGLTEKLQQERDNRRAKLSEILSRTREQSNSSSPVKSSDSDASALAKSLLARRNEKLNGSPKSDDGSSSPPNKLSTESEQKMVSLAEEFENLGLANNKFLLPGQLPDTHHHTNNLS